MATKQHDAVKQEIEPGSLVVYHREDNRLITGNMYTVQEINDNGIRIVGYMTTYSPLDFIKIRNYEPFNPDLLADRVMALINSKPQSPRKEELLALFRSVE